MGIQFFMRSTLAAAVVLACAMVCNAQDATPAQTPEQSAPEQPQPVSPETAPPSTEPTGPPPSDTPLPPQTETAPAATPENSQPSKPEVTQAKPTSPSKGASSSPKKKKAIIHKAKPKAKVKAPTEPSSEIAEKKVVRNGGTSEPEVQFTPRLTVKQQSDQKQKIANLLSATDANLQKVAGHELRSSEEEMAKQIRVYMEQAKQASEAGDLQRAQNLASKANLLSVELTGK
jgi:hypothetical protein